MAESEAIKYIQRDISDIKKLKADASSLKHVVDTIKELKDTKADLTIVINVKEDVGRMRSMLTKINMSLITLVIAAILNAIYSNGA